jgi:hypothetical protein
MAASVSDSGSDNSASTPHARLLYIQITGISQMSGTLIMHDSETRTACTAQSRQHSEGSVSHSALTDSNTPLAQHSPRHCTLIATRPAAIT